VKFDQGLGLSKIQRQAMLFISIFLFCMVSQIVCIHYTAQSIEGPWLHSIKTPSPWLHHEEVIEKKKHQMIFI
jgi:hypothetical protein